MRFLPTWDAVLLAHARRTLILPEEHRAQIFNTKMPQSVGTFLVDGAVAGAWRPDGTIEPFGSLDQGAARAGRSRGASADRLLRLNVGRVHAGPFIVFAEEAHEDSADLLFMPEATASDWATIFSHAEVRTSARASRSSRRASRTARSTC